MRMRYFGSLTNTRDYQTHIDDRDVLTRKKFKMNTELRFDQDPQGMGMPYKEFVTKDASRDMGEVSGRQVVYTFPNGYGASVVMGELFHTDTEHPYEIGLLKNGKLDYKVLDPDGNDVLGFQDDADLLIILAKLMDLPKEEK